MPEVLSSGVPIHYRVEGAGPPLVFHHGLADSADSWAELGYVEPLASTRQVILMDGRGHGASGKPHDPEEYTPRHQAQDVVAVLDDLGLATADFFGYSMGGRIGFALAKYAPGRVRSYIIGGATPFDLPIEVAKDMWRLLRKGTEGVVELWENQAPISAALRERLLANDIEALRAFFMSGRAHPDPLDDVPSTMKAPCLLIIGTEDFIGADAVLRCHRAMPNSTVVTLEGLNHLEAMQRSDLALPHVESFLDNLDAPT